VWWLLDWRGVNQSYVSYGFCEYQSVCHAPQVQSKEACDGLRSIGDEFPRWYDESGIDQWFTPKVRL